MNNVNWTELWKTKESTLQPKHIQALKLINFLVDKNKINSLCDFGCGQGLLLKEIKQLFPNIDICGADNN